MSDVIGVGQESQTDLAVTRLRVWGNILQRVGQFNPALSDFSSFGSINPYHRLEIRAGSPDQNGPAELADHSHHAWRNVRNIGVTTAGAARSNPMPQHRQYWQGIYTAGDPTDSVNSVNSFALHGGARDIRGTALANEISIDTTLTSPSGALSAGDVVFRHSTNPNVTAGTRYILEVTQQTVAGIQASMYNATVVTPSAETSPGSGIWQYTLSVQGLDGLHWTATAGTPGGSQQGLSTLTGNYSVAPATVLAVSSISVPSVSGDPNLLDVTLTSAPSSALIVGHVFSVMLGTGTSITGLTTNVWWPGTIVSVVGSVVRVRLGGSQFGLRYRANLTLGGTTDSDATRNVASNGVRDSQHDVIQGEILASQYRDGNGVAQAMGFGSCIFGATVARSVAVGMDLFVANNDEFVFGTSQANNRAVLSGNVLSVNGLKTGAAGVTVSRIRHGRATLVAGTVTVTDANVTTSTRIILNRYTTGGTLGHLDTGTRTAGTSFTINSSSATETSVIDWVAFEP